MGNHLIAYIRSIQTNQISYFKQLLLIKKNIFYTLEYLNLIRSKKKKVNFVEWAVVRNVFQKKKNGGT